MTGNTTNDYKNLIKKKFKEEKVGEFHSFLDNPTPANLRELCLLKFDNGLNKIDEKIFRIYFKVSDDENLRKTIFDYHIPNFKKIGNFLNEDEKDKNTNTVNLNLISVLIDFNPRPYNKFSRSFDEEKYINETQTSTKESDINLVDIENKNTTFIGMVETGVLPQGNTKDDSKKSNWIKKNIKHIAVGTTLFIVVFIGMNYFSKDKGCMTWMENHFEEVDCNAINENRALFIVAKDANLIQNFRKIIPCDTTKYERNGRVCLWYGKTPDGAVDFFTHHGIHPEFGKTLKEVTATIMNKYGKGPCN